MKKPVVVAILLLVVALTLPTFVTAEASAVSDITYFLDPTAIATVQGKLFVADKIESGKSVILCFDVSGDKPNYCFTQEVDGDVEGLSSKEGGLYAVLSNKVVEYTVGDNALTQATVFAVQPNPVNMVYGAFGDTKTEIYATTTQLYRNGGDKFWGVGLGNFDNFADILALDDGFLYYLYGNDSANLKRANGKNSLGLPEEDVVNDKLDISNSGAKGLFAWTTDQNKTFPAYFSDNAVHYVEIADSICNPVALISDYPQQNGTITDVASDGQKLFVLNSQHKVDIYTKNNENTLQVSATIGTETLSGDVPTKYTSFTLVKSAGYPSNIVFKTGGENSVERLIENAEQYIVLGYDGAEESPFYYVLIGDKFGWVKKSDNATSPQNDGKLQVVDTAMSHDVVEYKTEFKFNSLGAVYLAPLPNSSYMTEKYWTVHNQSATNRTEVTVLQRFTEGQNVWYYVSFGNTKGFVKQEDVGQFYLSANIDGLEVVGDRKVNGTLFGYVQLYDNNNPDTMDEAHHARTDEKELEHLSSGTRVTLIKQYDNGTSLVQVLYDDGTTVTGYCFSDRLIAVTALTTNAVFGLVVMCVAVTLAVVLTVVFLRRRKRTQPTASPAETEENLK